MNKLLNWYLTETQNNNLIYDEIQANVVKEFDKFLAIYNSYNYLSRFFAVLHLNRYTTKKLGFYIYGNVGRGKSMLMNEFYSQFPEHHKLRIHFHEFMHNIHQKLAELKDKKNPLATIAKNFKRQYRIIFLDEMHISDIATAMILKNLFENLFKENIYIITSSNYAPTDLYHDGLMRERFIPAIKLFEKYLKIINLESPRDYRLINSSINHLFLINIPPAHEDLLKLFNKISHNKSVTTNGLIEIQKRKISFEKKSHNIIWFSFDIICGDLRSQLDYLELAQNFNWFIIEDVRQLLPKDKEMARRFTLFIDILYDENKKLILSSSCDINNIYIEGDFAIEFKRTISRLSEMQTDEYLNKKPINPIIET
ncbi:MAG: cell division protein ZapE [Neisseriaceae bacterium]